MFLPLGLDETRLSRIPRASLAIAGLCLATFLLTQCSGSERELRRAAEEVERYHQERPYLTVPGVLVERFGLDVAALRPAAVPAALAEEDVRREQAQLQRLAEALVAAVDARPGYRYALVPARGALQPGWISYQFMHAGWMHLIGNLLVFLLVVGPFLEDVWGVLFFSAFYLAGGVVAGLFQLPFTAPDVAIVGASGSISACLGAFMLRFAHRKVRVFWFPVFPLVVIRKQLSVPAWLYAVLGFAMDALALQLSDASAGGVAHGAHVGGFLFGVGVALTLRLTGLEARFAPEGAVGWKQGMALNRAADALAAGDVYGARARLHEAIAKRPANLDARLELARLEAAALNTAAATEALEPVLAQKLAADDLAGAQALLGELQGRIRLELLRPATAYRLAEAVERQDRALALSLLEAAGAAGGGLGAKALARAAQLVAAREPDRARALLDRAEPLSADPGIAARIRAVRGTLPSPPEPEPEPHAADGPGLREVWCRVSGIDGAYLTLVTPDGRAVRLDPARVAHVATALLGSLRLGGQERRNAVVLDLLLHSTGPGPRVLLRIAGHEMGLAAHRPGVAPAVAFAELVEAFQLEGAAAWPDAARAQGKPFARFPDLAAYEAACYGRSL